MFLCSYEICTLKYDSEVLECWSKNCGFYERSKLGYFAIKNGQRTGSSFMLNFKL